MPFDQQQEPLNKVRLCIGELLRACSAAPDVGAVVSVHMPGQTGCDGFMGGPETSLAIAIGGAIERIYDVLARHSDSEAAIDALIGAIQDATGVRLERAKD